VVFIAFSAVIFLKYYLAFSHIILAVALIGPLLSTIFCPMILTIMVPLTRLCKFGWIVPQIVVIYGTCSFVLRVIFLNIDEHISFILILVIPLIFLLVESWAQWAIRKTLMGSVDNTFLVAVFGMLWNANLEGVRFLSFVTLILRAVEAKWNKNSTAPVIGNFVATGLTKVWTLGGLRFFLMPRILPCQYKSESEVLSKSYYSIGTVTEYSAPIV